MSLRGIFTHVGIILHILDCLGHDMQVLYLGRAPRTKETLPDFLKWRRVTRPPTCIPRVDGKSTDPRVLGRHIFNLNMTSVVFNRVNKHFNERLSIRDLF